MSVHQYYVISKEKTQRNEKLKNQSMHIVYRLSYTEGIH